MFYRKSKLPFTTILGVIFILITFLSLSGCAKNEGAAVQAGGKLSVVATTTMLADLARQIGGDHLVVQGLMGPGIDPHLYQASAGDVTKLQGADIVLYNGLHLEGKMGDIFASLQKQDKAVICVEDGLDKGSLLFSEDDENLYDPHIWFDVTLWQAAATYVADAFAAVDQENADGYGENLEAYLWELEELTVYINRRIEELPQNQRVLITAHDAFQYFGMGYGFEVKGLQGISTDAEAGTADMMHLAEFIADNEIKAIFIESSVPPKTIEALQAAVQARGFNVAIGGELYSDSLGDAGSGADTYIRTFKANIDTIVNALK